MTLFAYTCCNKNIRGWEENSVTKAMIAGTLDVIATITILVVGILGQRSEIEMPLAASYACFSMGALLTLVDTIIVVWMRSRSATKAEHEQARREYWERQPEVKEARSSITTSKQARKSFWERPGDQLIEVKEARSSITTSEQARKSFWEQLGERLAKIDEARSRNNSAKLARKGYWEQLIEVEKGKSRDINAKPEQRTYWKQLREQLAEVERVRNRGRESSITSEPEWKSAQLAKQRTHLDHCNKENSPENEQSSSGRRKKRVTFNKKKMVCPITPRGHGKKYSLYFPKKKDPQVTTFLKTQ